MDEDQCLVGTLTDGDIRRALLEGETLQAPVERLMNRNFRSASSSNDQGNFGNDAPEVLRQIPILDEWGHVVQLLLLQELLNLNN